MPTYSSHSKNELSTATYNLQRLFKIVVHFYDNTIIQGWRSEKMQQRMYETGVSQVKYGKHNESPAQAVDSAPYLQKRGIPWPKVPKNWTDTQARDRYIRDLNQFFHYVGFVEGVAANEGIPIRSGADWNRNHDVTDQSWLDLVHFEEVISPKPEEV